MTIVMARELERIGVRVNAIAPVARTRLTEALAGGRHERRRKATSTASPPRTSAAVGGLARVRPRGGHLGPGGEGAGRRACSSSRAGGRSPRSTSDEAVDDRQRRRSPRRSCSRRPTARHPAVLLAVAARGLTPGEAAPGAPEDEAFRAELVAFLDEHAPPEADGGLRLRRRADGGRACSPTWARAVAGDAVRPRLDDPGVPARARRPQLHAGADAHLPGGDGDAGACRASLHFPGYAIVAPSLLEFGNDEQKALAPAAIRGDTVWCIGMSEPNAGSRPRRRSRRAPSVDGDRFVVNGQKVWTSLRDGRREVLLLRAHRSRPRRSTRASASLILDMDTPGIDVRPLRHLTGAADFAEVFFTDVEVPRDEPRRRAQRRLAHHHGLARARARRAVGRERRPARDRRSTTSSRSPRRLGLDRDAGVRRAHGDALRACRRACARSATRASRAFAQGSSAPEHSFMKLATSELGKALFELGMELQGTVRRGHRPDRRRGARPLGHVVLHELRRHHRRRHLGDPAQHHRPARPRPAARDVGASAWTSPSPTTRSCCGTRPRQLLGERVPAVAAARAHRRPDRGRPAVAPPPRVRRARRRPPRRPVPVPRGGRVRRRAGTLLRDRRAVRAAAGGDRRRASGRGAGRRDLGNGRDGRRRRGVARQRRADQDVRARGRPRRLGGDRARGPDGFARRHTGRPTAVQTLDTTASHVRGRRRRERRERPRRRCRSDRSGGASAPPSRSPPRWWGRPDGCST